MFWDSVEISVKAGDGGNGLISFRHEHSEAKGGPDGGDGGHGGSVRIRATHQLNTLVDFARKRKFRAESGKPGGKARKHGKSADDLVLDVPIGTMVIENEALIADLVDDKQEAVLAKGGHGGFGNAHFTSSVRQTPRQAELGEPGEEKALKLDLKLVADLGLVGIPSVGKSTLLSRITAAKPKIAEYPFTTTAPQLGITKVGGTPLVVADIPGLLEGAHKGKGLGDAFLRHIERTKVIIHLLDATAKDPVKDYLAIRHELESFSQALVAKPEAVALNKTDALDAELTGLVTEDVSNRLGRPVRPISAASGAGLKELLQDAAKLVERHRPTPTPETVPVFTLADLAPKSVTVTKGGSGYVARGAKLERLAAQTDFDNEEATNRFWWVADRLGVGKQLEKLQAKPGVTLKVGQTTLKWPG